MWQGTVAERTRLRELCRHLRHLRDRENEGDEESGKADFLGSQTWLKLAGLGQRGRTVRMGEASNQGIGGEEWVEQTVLSPLFLASLWFRPLSAILSHTDPPWTQ